MRLHKIKINERAALDGDWIDDLPGFEDYAVHIRSLDCPAALAYQRDLFKKVLGRQKSRKDRDIPPEILDYVNAKTLIDVCVSDWKNVSLPIDKDGAVTFDDDAVVSEREFPFAKETLETVLLEPAPDGIVTQPAPGQDAKAFYTPDRKRARFSMREFIYINVIAAERVSAPEDKAAEKNGSGAGSPGSGANRSKTKAALSSD